MAEQMTKSDVKAQIDAVEKGVKDLLKMYRSFGKVGSTRRKIELDDQTIDSKTLKDVEKNLALYIDGLKDMVRGASKRRGSGNVSALEKYRAFAEDWARKNKIDIKVALKENRDDIKKAYAAAKKRRSK